MKVFFDQDGVLTIYKQEDFNGEHPKHHIPGYFETCKPNRKSVNLFKKLYKCKINNSKKIDIENIYVLTTVDTLSKLNKFQIKDKITWCNKYIFKNANNNKARCYLKAVVGQTKSERAKKLLKRELNKSDILIDDYNKNLKDWQEAGGTAVKFLNGLNDLNSWNGPYIDNNMPIYEKINILNKFASEGTIA